MTSFSPEFEKTLRRALALANEELSPWSTLEHFLLALLDDQDALEVLLACGADIAELRTRLTNYIKYELPASDPPVNSDLGGAALERVLERSLKWFSVRRDEEESSKPTAGFQRVIQRAVIHVQAAGKEVVTGANALIAIFAEKESQAVHFLQEQDVTRYDAVNYVSHGISRTERSVDEKIARDIEEIASSSPVFSPIDGKLRFQQTPAVDDIRERKAAVQERYERLKRLCDSRANEQPEFKRLVDRYGVALSKLTSQSGAYALFLAGFELETLLKIKAQSKPDLERNPPMDSDQLFATQSLIVAHAGLITLFPDIQVVTTELDRYRQMSAALEALQDRVLDPVFRQLTQANEIFDEETLRVASEMHLVDVALGSAGASVTQGATAVKHSWIRGALAAIGQYLLRQGKEVTKVARDAAVKEGVSHALKNPDQLSAAMLQFLQQSKPMLLSLADSLQSQFGWLLSLLSHLRF